MSIPPDREPPSNGRIEPDTISPTDLVLGAVHGFTEHQADTILASADLLRQLHRLWNAAPPTSIVTALAAEPIADGAAQHRLLDAAYAGAGAGREPTAGPARSSRSPVPGNGPAAIVARRPRPRPGDFWP